MHRKYFLLRILIPFLAVCLEVNAQLSINKSVLGNGGETMKNENYALNGTLGQTIIGNQNDISLRAKLGFWYQANTLVTAIDEISENVTQQTTLLSSYPNPFYSRTKISYMVSPSVYSASNYSEGGSKVEIKVYDTGGKEVAMLVHKVQSVGLHEIEWNADHLPGGIYYCRLRQGNLIQTIQMILIN